ncbi:hypothetical protein V5799_006690 [Amblyomma americanum]|uniref:Uncharacterized protein n=1 Tax=Amblyomma americanum TaxID=6943 RepID=A0AAQ4DVN5_AMBAM
MDVILRAENHVAKNIWLVLFLKIACKEECAFYRKLIAFQEKDHTQNLSCGVLRDVLEAHHAGLLNYIVQNLLRRPPTCTGRILKVS